MTMNTRQAGAFTELIKKEEAARERWYATHGAAYAARQATLKAAKAQAQGAQPQGQTPRTMSGSASARGTLSSGLTGTAWGSQSARTLGHTGSLSREDNGGYSDPFTSPSYVTRRELHTQEVPYVRQVAVPVTTSKVVEVLVPKRVQTKKLVESDEYTEREQLVRVQVPVRRYRQVDDWTTVMVPEQRETVVNGLRVDELEETKLVEQEELRQYALQPVPTGRVEVLTQRDLGHTGRRVARRSGQHVYEEGDPRVAGLPLEPDTPSAYRPRSAASSGRSRPSSARSGYYGQSFGAGASFSQSQPLQQQYGQSQQPQSQRLGFRVRTSSANPGTCVVFDVESGGLAQRGGLKGGDVILSTNGRQTASLQDFKNAVAGSRGPLLLQVRRGTDRFVITLHR